jgi:hypothetical protein
LRILLTLARSSGIQVLPAIREKVKHCTTFIREPTYVSPVQGLEGHVYSQEELQDFATKPGALLEYRKNIERGLNGQFSIFLKGAQLNLETREYMLEQMKQKLNNEYLEAKLIPEWSVGCRRLTPGINYLESLTKPNVTVVYGEIDQITENGCVSNGNEYPVDVLICATGFDTTFKPRFPLIGPSGNNLQDVWANEPQSYLGMAAANFPNYLIFVGPNSPVGNGPVLSAIEAQADYMLKMIDRFQTQSITSFAPRQEAVDEFIAFKDDFMKKTVWFEPCRSWYKTGQDAPITALWPGSTLHYIETLQDPRIDDWEFKYTGNRFEYLGNGYSQTELDQTADWGYYIREYDDQEPLTTGGKRKLISKSGTISSIGGFSGLIGKKGEDTTPRAQL